MLLFLKHSICLSGFFPNFLLSGMHILKNKWSSMLVVFCDVRTHKLEYSTTTPAFVSAACFFVISTTQLVSIPLCWLISFPCFLPICQLSCIMHVIMYFHVGYDGKSIRSLCGVGRPSFLYAHFPPFFFNPRDFVGLLFVV